MARILVVEDDADVHALLQMLLEDAGHTVWSCTDGQAALTLATGTGQAPDLVLLDGALPGELDGLDVVRALRAHPLTAEVPVVMLTARSRPQDEQQGIEAGATEYVLKPFDTDALLGRVSYLLG